VTGLPERNPWACLWLVLPRGRGHDPCTIAANQVFVALRTRRTESSGFRPRTPSGQLSVALRLCGLHVQWQPRWGKPVPKFTDFWGCALAKLKLAAETISGLLSGGGRARARDGGPEVPGLLTAFMGCLPGIRTIKICPAHHSDHAESGRTMENLYFQKQTVFGQGTSNGSHSANVPRSGL